MTNTLTLSSLWKLACQKNVKTQYNDQLLALMRSWLQFKSEVEAALPVRIPTWVQKFSRIPNWPGFFRKIIESRFELDLQHYWTQPAFPLAHHSEEAACGLSSGFNSPYISHAQQLADLHVNIFRPSLSCRLSGVSYSNADLGSNGWDSDSDVFYRKRHGLSAKLSIGRSCSKNCVDFAVDLPAPLEILWPEELSAAFVQ